MSNRELNTALGSLAFSRRILTAFLDGTPEEFWYHIPIPGGNHAAWIAGHVAWEDDDCLNALVEGRQSALPPTWRATFGTGSQSTPNAADYPPITEIRSTLAATRATFIEFFRAAPDRLAELIPKSLHGFARDRASLMHAVACHEMVHVGQLTVIRKSLKLPPVFA